MLVPLMVTVWTAMYREYFQLKADPPRSEWKAVMLTVKINEVSDLWRVCLKSPYARIEIPELEFEISADGKRHVDSIYNHIGNAVYNLGNYVQQANSGESLVVGCCHRSFGLRWVEPSEHALPRQ